MEVKVVSQKIYIYLGKHNLLSKWYKAIFLFEENMYHPSLRAELLKPKEERIYSFRIDRKYRALFVIKDGKAFVFRVTNHYK
jgi:Txe/YoeB family toxin of Txe-Axe toxin-antitoxin module